ncbi:MAG: class I SAM-dependent methyltransferase [Flavobacteriales bacterium]|nr:class I SAM-dependent methyltransferase [Flavobacteriales bacterium]
MRSTERFTGLANIYGQARPTYPQELVRWCLEQAPAPGVIVDLGCGTGISTRLFASTGHPVIGIDPNADMLATARAEGAQDYRVGSSEHTGLPDACADLIIAAQAFHWFDLDGTFAEVERIGTPRSACVAFWNVRLEDTPFMQGYETLLRTWSTQYEVNERAGRTINAIRERATQAVLREFLNPVPMDRERVRNLALSSSYVKHGVADIPAFLQALDALLDATSTHGKVQMRYATRAIAWRVHG